MNYVHVEIQTFNQRHSLDISNRDCLRLLLLEFAPCSAGEAGGTPHLLRNNGINDRQDMDEEDKPKRGDLTLTLKHVIGVSNLWLIRNIETPILNVDKNAIDDLLRSVGAVLQITSRFPCGLEGLD
jgi:hypothetical protein